MLLGSTSSSGEQMKRHGVSSPDTVSQVEGKEQILLNSRKILIHPCSTQAFLSVDICVVTPQWLGMIRI